MTPVMCQVEAEVVGRALCLRAHAAVILCCRSFRTKPLLSFCREIVYPNYQTPTRTGGASIPDSHTLSSRHPLNMGEQGGSTWACSHITGAVRAVHTMSPTHLLWKQ